jgi:hypothetical protein
MPRCLNGMGHAHLNFGHGKRRLNF